jgi:group I intron endonuclease
VANGLIYCITNTTNGKQYVGQTIMSSAVVRWRQHVMAALKGSTDCDALFAAIRKYGEAAFVVEEIERTADMDAREQFHIARLGSLSPNGYNLTPGGIRFEMTAETRKKISAANAAVLHTPEWNANMAAALKGRVVSEETRAKLSAAKRGKPGYMPTAEQRAARSARMMGNKNGQGNKGKPLTEETRVKLSQARTGTKLSDEHKRKISISLIGNTRRHDYELKRVADEQS